MRWMSGRLHRPATGQGRRAGVRADLELAAAVLSWVARAYVTENEYEGGPAELVRRTAEDYRFRLTIASGHPATDETCSLRLLRTAAVLRASVAAPSELDEPLNEGPLTAELRPTSSQPSEPARGTPNTAPPAHRPA